MSRRVTVRRFTPSVYSCGLQPASPEKDYSLGYAEYGMYGRPFPLSLLLDKEEEDEVSPLSVALKYWWLFVPITPILYIGMDYGMKKIGEYRNAKKQ